MPFLISVLAILLVYFSPTVLTRTLKFFAEDQGSDKGRSWELSYAQELFRSSARVGVIGVGLDGQITPGQHGIDPRWNENSKFDIENVFWALLVKTGAIGCTYILFLFYRIRRSAMFLAIIAIEMIGGVGSSGLFFGSFDGTFLLAWSIVVIKLEESRETSSARVFGNRRLAPQYAWRRPLANSDAQN